MDPRLTDIDLMMRTMDTDDRDDSRRELAFAILAVDENDHATLNWLAACCAKRAGDLTGYEPGGEDTTYRPNGERIDYHPSGDPLELAKQIADLTRRVTPDDGHPSQMVSIVPIQDQTYTHVLRVGETEPFIGYLSDVAALAVNVGEELADA